MDTRRKLFLSLLIGVAALHAGALSGGFVWDDHTIIEANPDIRSLANVPEMFTRNYFDDRADSELFRPLVNVTLAVDTAVCGGDPHPFPFHLTNFVLHLAAGLLLYGLFCRLALPDGVAEIGALIFLVHPASAEPVAWIVGRGDLLAAVLGLATIHLHLSGRRRPWLHGLAAVTWLLALFGKLSAAPVPLLLLLIERRTPQSGESGSDPSSPFAWGWRYGAYAAAAGLYFAVRANAMGSVFPSGPGLTWKDPDGLASIVVAGAVTFRMLWTSLFPVGLCADYSADPVFDGANLSRISADPLVFLTAAAVPALVLAVVFLRRRAPLLSLGLLWFFLALIPVAQAVRIGAVMADRFLYLPSVGIALVLAAGLVAIPRWRIPAGAALLACLALLTWQREAVWRTDLSMNRDVLKASNYPRNADAWNRLGLAYSQAGAPEREMEAYREGLLHAPGNRYLLKNLGAALLEAGRLPEAREALTAALSQSRSRDLQAAKIVYNLALVLERQGEAAEAARLLEEALEGAGRLPAELRRRMAVVRDRARRNAAPR